MRYRLRTLLIVLALGPMVLAGAWFYGLPLERWFQSEATPSDLVTRHSVTTTTEIDLLPMMIAGSLLMVTAAVVFVLIWRRRPSNT